MPDFVGFILNSERLSAMPFTPVLRVILLQRNHPAFQSSIPALCIIGGCIAIYLSVWTGIILIASLVLFGSTKSLTYRSLLICLSGFWLIIVSSNRIVISQKTGRHNITGTILQIHEKPYGTRLLLHSKPHGKGIVQVKPGHPEIRPGCHIEALGFYTPISIGSNPGGFSQKKYFQSNGFGWSFNADSIKIIGTPNRMFRLITFVQRLLNNHIEKNIPGPSQGIFSAMLLGERRNLSTETKSAFSDSGMYHLLAISGLHVGIIGLILNALLKLCRLPHRLSLILSGTLLLIYIPITGTSISVVRAVFMFWGMIIYKLLNRPRTALHMLVYTAAVCLVWKPFQILHLGFQLSFCATFFLILYGPVFGKINQITLHRTFIYRYAYSTVSVSVLLLFATLPILSQSIHQIAPLAIIGNIGTIAAASGALFSGVLSFIFCFIPPVSGVFGHASHVFIQLLNWSVNGLSRIPLSHFWMASSGPIISLLLYLFLLLFPFMLRLKLWRPFLLMILCCYSFSFCASAVHRAFFTPIQVTFLDVGQGDACILELPDKTTIIYDTGPDRAGKKVLYPFLKSKGIQSIDLLIISHADRDHYGGGIELSKKVRIKRLLIPPNTDVSPHWSHWVDTLKATSAVTRVQCKDTLFKNPDVTLWTINPCPDNITTNRNEGSIVLILSAHGRQMMFTGDIGFKTEERLIENGAFDIDILKVAHHGSKYSTHTEFLSWCKPEIALISAGQKNRYQHPHPDVISRIREHGAEIYSTTRAGAVSIRVTKGSELAIHPFRNRIHPAEP